MSAITDSAVGNLTAHHSVARRILYAVLWVLTGLLVIITAMPVFLLFVATAVPLYVSILLVAADVGLLVVLFRFERTALLVGAVILAFILIAFLAVWLSQVYATTPPITDAQGNPVPGSIATLEKVQLGDSEQWISIRGKDVNRALGPHRAYQFSNGMRPGEGKMKGGVESIGSMGEEKKWKLNLGV